MEGSLQLPTAYTLIPTAKSESIHTAKGEAISSNTAEFRAHVEGYINVAEASSIMKEVYLPELLCIFCFDCKINHIKKTQQGVRLPTRLMSRQHVWVEITQLRAHSITIRLLPHIQQSTQVNGYLSAAQVFSRVKNSCPFCVCTHYMRTTCIDCSDRQFRWDSWNPFDNSIEEATNEDLTFEITIEEFSAMVECTKIHP
jgi:hypothetical protein